MTSKRRALFLDRDGVINVDHGYVHRPEQIDFLDGIFELCREASELNYLIIVITNQAGIGRGYYTEQQFHDLMSWIGQEFTAQGAHIDQVYFCPYHAQHGIGDYKKESLFRKPEPGMILQAADEHHLNLADSILVGDKVSDIEAGLTAGVGCNLLFATSVMEKLMKTSPTAIVESISQVRRFL